MNQVVPLSGSEWIKGDYRHAASLRPDVVTIEALAQRINAEIESVIEDGLGVMKAFGVGTPQDWQFAFDFYVSAPSPNGVNLLLLFENDKCSRKQMLEALDFFGLSESDTWWICPWAV